MCSRVQGSPVCPRERTSSDRSSTSVYRREPCLQSRLERKQSLYYLCGLTGPAQGIEAKMECRIRPALEDDADEISGVILRSLRETNAKHYKSEIIERVEGSFSPFALRGLISKRTVFVATMGSRIVGTASLDGSVVRTVFVAPDAQSQGFGKLLMAQIEQTARERNIPVLVVPSSITAETFYSRLGFKAVREAYHGDERTIIMERPLGNSL